MHNIKNNIDQLCYTLNTEFICREATWTACVKNKICNDRYDFLADITSSKVVSLLALLFEDTQRCLYDNSYDITDSVKYIVYELHIAYDNCTDQTLKNIIHNLLKIMSIVRDAEYTSELMYNNKKVLYKYNYTSSIMLQELLDKNLRNIICIALPDNDYLSLLEEYLYMIDNQFANRKIIPHPILAKKIQILHLVEAMLRICAYNDFYEGLYQNTSTTVNMNIL